jgi:Domain of Unknown Function (DUF748)
VSRFRRRTLIIAAAALGVLVVVLLVVLPLLVRWVAVNQLTKLTGRAVALADVDLNLFTGRVILHRFRLAQRGSDASALEFDRLEVRVAPTSLVTRNIRVSELVLTTPRLFVARLGPDRFEFDDLLALAAPPDPSKPPAKSTRTVTLERLSLTRGQVVARDEAVTPPSTWKVEDISIEGTGISTRPGVRPGRLVVRTRINGSALAFEADAVDVARTAIDGRLTLGAFELAQAVPYVPSTVAVLPTGGRLTLDLQLKTSRPADGPLGLVIGGTVGLAEVAIARRGVDEPLLRVPRLSVAIKEAKPLESAVTLAGIDVDGMDLHAARDRQGQIDLLALAGPPEAAPSTTPAPATSPATETPSAGAARPFKLTVERLALTRGRAAFRDEVVTPVSTLVVSDIGITVTNLTWPGGAPLGLEASFGLPTAGRVTTKGTVTLTPFSTDLTTSLRGGSIEPYHPYIPFKARLAGRFNGDSRTQVAIDDAGHVTAKSKGTSWIEALEVRNPTDRSVPFKLERLELAGIDFGWPTHARVATVTMKRPNARIERDASGALPLRELFDVQEGAKPAKPEPAKAEPAKKESAKKEQTKPATKKPPAAKSEQSVPADVAAAGGAVGFPLDIGAVVIDDGYMQFLDRTVQPAFSETLSRLAVRVEGLSSTPGRRAKLTTQAIVGGDAALDVKGELAPLGQLYADIQGELRDFTLARVNPYADSFIAWIVDRGKLGVRFHYRIERDHLEASNEIFINNIHVAPTRQEDEVKKKVGLPLGLIVALITDGNNDLKLNLPMSGPLATWKADLADAIWTVVRNVVVNIVAAPFRGIGKLFTSKDNKVEGFSVEPVTFPAGADTVTGPMEEHLTKVADFLRRAPAIRLALTPVASPADVESLKGQELTARLQTRQRNQKLADFPAAVLAEFKERFPLVPGAQPPSPDAQLARLREVEPVPDAKVAELLARRERAVREGLVKNQGIPDARLAAAEPAAATPAGNAAPPAGTAPSGSAAAPGGTAASGNAPSAGTPAPGSTPPSSDAAAPGGTAAPGSATSPGGAPTSASATPPPDAAPAAGEGRVEFRIVQ